MKSIDLADVSNDSGNSSPPGKAALVGDRAGAQIRGGPGLKMAAYFAKATSLALVSVDASGIIRFANQAAADMFGHSIEDMFGRSVEMIIPERLRKAHRNGFALAMTGQELNTGGSSVEVHGLRVDGTEFPIELTLCAWNENGTSGAGAIIKDITERREREARLLRLASRDVLTGLRNRHGFGEALAECMAGGSPTTVVVLDLDGFKDINAVHGHGAGDALLQAVAIRLPRTLPVRAVVARFGADEFAVFIPGLADPLDAKAAAASIEVAFSKPFSLPGDFSLNAAAAERVKKIAANTKASGGQKIDIIYCPYFFCDGTCEDMSQITLQEYEQGVSISKAIRAGQFTLKRD